MTFTVKSKAKLIYLKGITIGSNYLKCLTLVIIITNGVLHYYLGKTVTAAID